MGEKTYAEKLKDPRWQKKRLEVLERGGWQCRLCGDTENTLAVHHRYYESGKEPWEYPLDAFVALCEDCHEAERVQRCEYESLLLKVLRRKFFADDLRLLAFGFSCLDLQDTSYRVARAYTEALKSAKTQTLLLGEL